MPAIVTCKKCESTIQKYYYEQDGLSLCPGCATTAKAAESAAGKSKRTLLAVAFGIVGGLIGAAVFAGVAILSGRFWGYFAILVGLGAGYGVKLGSENRGGLTYQLLAVGIAYACMGCAYLGVIGHEILSSVPSAIETPVTEAPIPATDSGASPSTDAAQSEPAPLTEAEVANRKAAAEAEHQKALDEGPWYLKFFEDLAKGDIVAQIIALVLLGLGFLLLTPLMLVSGDPISLIFFLLAAGYAWKANANGSSVGPVTGPKMLEGAVKEGGHVMEA